MFCELIKWLYVYTIKKYAIPMSKDPPVIRFPHPLSICQGCCIITTNYLLWWFSWYLWGPFYNMRVRIFQWWQIGIILAYPLHFCFRHSDILSEKSIYFFPRKKTTLKNGQSLEHLFFEKANRKQLHILVSSPSNSFRANQSITSYEKRINNDHCPGNHYNTCFW